MHRSFYFEAVECSGANNELIFATYIARKMNFFQHIFDIEDYKWRELKHLFRQNDKTDLRLEVMPHNFAKMIINYAQFLESELVEKVYFLLRLIDHSFG